MKAIERGVKKSEMKRRRDRVNVKKTDRAGKRVDLKRRGQITTNGTGADVKTSREVKRNKNCAIKAGNNSLRENKSVCSIMMFLLYASSLSSLLISNARSALWRIDFKRP